MARNPAGTRFGGCCLGTRAVAFAPVADLGLAVLWDDGDDLHAEPRAPYPHARLVLGQRAVTEDVALLVAGFARTAETQLSVDTGGCTRSPRAATCWARRRPGSPRSGRTTRSSCAIPLPGQRGCPRWPSRPPVSRWAGTSRCWCRPRGEGTSRRWPAGSAGPGPTVVAAPGRSRSPLGPPTPSPRPPAAGAVREAGYRCAACGSRRRAFIGCQGRGWPGRWLGAGTTGTVRRC